MSARAHKADPGEASAPDSMYAAHEKIHPREIKGRYQAMRKIMVFLLLGLFYVLPWVRIGGEPAILFDLPARQFHILGLTFWPQDFFYLTLLLVICALALFFVTSLAGRVWCGYACPQTVWTEVFLWMEHWTEGKRAKRMKLDRGPWNAEKILRKGSKQVLWIVFSLWTGFTFVGFFSPIDELLMRAAAFQLGAGITTTGESAVDNLDIRHREFRMVFEGGYQQTVEFLDSLEMEDIQLVWRSLDYKVTEYPDARVTVRFDLYAPADFE